MRSGKHFGFTLMLTFFMIGTLQALAQKNHIDSVKNFTGTWSGYIANQTVKGMQLSTTVWRIHNIDNSRQKIEMTEISKLIDTLELIKKPKRRFYKGNVNNDQLWIELNDAQGKKKRLTFRLSFEEVYTLIAVDEHGKLVEGSKFVKVSDDTSSFVKPEGTVEVSIQPPPAVD